MANAQLPDRSKDTIATVAVLVAMGIMCLLTAWVTGMWWIDDQPGASLYTACCISAPLGLLGILFCCLGVSLLFKKE